MIIDRIKLQDFRSYYGAQEINLSAGLNDEHNVVAVGGLNGAGKTSLIDGIGLGLLGEIDFFEFLKKKQRKGDDLRAIERERNGWMNRQALAEGKRETSI